MLSYSLHEKRKCDSFSISFKWQKEQIRKFTAVLGIVWLPVSIRSLWFPTRNLFTDEFCDVDCLSYSGNRSLGIFFKCGIKV